MADTTSWDSRMRRATDIRPDSAQGAPEVHIDELLEFVVETSASDLHLTPGLPPMVRRDGELSVIPDTPVLSPEMTSALLDTIMSIEQRQVFDVEWELDLSFGRRGLGRYRVNAFMEKGDPAIAIRRIPDLPPSIEELGLPQVLLEVSRLKRGLVLVTGPTGSGKTTTLAALINQINHERTEHIITIDRS